MNNILNLKTPIRLGESQVEFASLDNPTITWMDFVFTDDLPNANGVGVKVDQFASILRTGILMPLKSAEGVIAPGHEKSLPLGVIASLESKYNETDNKNDILGKAALWAEERPEDIEQIKSAYAAGENLEISWELLYRDVDVDDSGIRWLKDPIVRAATLVGVPAYQGRTPVLAVAALEGAEDEISEDTKVELEELTQKLAEATSRIAELESQLAGSGEELSALREYKSGVEAKEAKAALLNARLTAFAENGIQFSDEEISAKQENWLKLDDEAFTFLVGEMKTLKAAKASADEKPDVKIPATSAKPALVTKDEILAELLKVAGK